LWESDWWTHMFINVNQFIISYLFYQKVYLSQSIIESIIMDPHVKGALIGGLSTVSAMGLGYLIKKSFSANNVTSL